MPCEEIAKVLSTTCKRIKITEEADFSWYLDNLYASHQHAMVVLSDTAKNAAQF